MKVGLALSGGAARAAGHVGVLKVLERESINIDAISGCSGGSVVGALYCSGRYSAVDIERISHAFKWRDFARPVYPVSGLISSETIYKYMRKLIGDICFEDLKIPLLVVATDFMTGERIVFSSGSVARAIQASCSLPVIFSPVKMDGKILIDGGFSSQLPVLALKENLGCERIIAVDVNYDCGNKKFHNNIFGVMHHFLALSAINSCRVEKGHSDVLVEVSARGVELYHFRKAGLMIKRGELAVEQRLAEIKKLC